MLIFINGVEINKFIAKDLQTNLALLCLDNVSQDVSAGNTKKIELYVYDFSVDFDRSDTLDIHKYLMVK